jgi:hypothetical protein
VTRDLALGAALRSLDVPDHAPGFYAQLHARLAEERVASLDDVRRRRRARQARLRWAARAGAAAAAAAVALLFFLPRDERVPDAIRQETASAAAIKAKVASALAQARTVRGRLVIEGKEALVFADRDRIAYTFAYTEQGDFRLHGLTHREELAYDAKQGVERQYFVDSDGVVSAGVLTGLAPGFPDPSPSDWIVGRRYGSVVRALRETQDGVVRRVRHKGRTAWRLDVDVQPSWIVPELTADHLRIVVDRETGFPVAIAEQKQGRLLRRTTLEKLEVNGELPPGSFALEFPPAAKPNRLDLGYRRVELSDVAAKVGYAPLVPAWTPDGYELAEVAVARRGGPTGTEAANPSSRMVVSLSYRRGLDQFLVTTRLSRVEAPGERELPLEELWGDPLATGEGYPDEPESITLRKGALEDVDVELLIVPRNVPHLWALTGELVVTVGGDLSRAELIQIAESLERQR